MLREEKEKHEKQKFCGSKNNRLLWIVSTKMGLRSHSLPHASRSRAMHIRKLGGQKTYQAKIAGAGLLFVQATLLKTEGIIKQER